MLHIPNGKLQFTKKKMYFMSSLDVLCSLNYHSVFLPALSITAFSTGKFVKKMQAVSTAGHGCAFTCYLQYEEVLTWQAELTEEQQYHEQGVWNGHILPDGSTLKPHRNCA